MNSGSRIQYSEFQKLVFIALGSNLGNSRQIVRDAMVQLQNLSEQPTLRSSLWQTSPVDCPPGSPKFVNAVVGFTPLESETPESLLQKLRDLEKEFGRTPKNGWNDPRLLDLDLIAFGAETRQTVELVLPHPRAHFRRFVLQPMAEIAPDLILPGQSKTVAQLLAGLPDAETVTRLV